MHSITEPLTFEFFRHALLAAWIAGTLCGLLGVYIVLRGMSYIGHGLSHAAFGGAAVAYVLKTNYYFAAGLWALGSALLINKISRGGRIKADAAIGIVSTASFALGIALVSAQKKFTLSFEAALFGNILAVGPDDLRALGAVFLVALIVIHLFYPSLLFTTFDEETARVFGFPTAAMELLFSLILAATIIVSMNILGVTMIAAALVIPSASARMITNSFHRMMLYSALMGGGTALAGVYGSYYLDTATGATIVLFSTLLFLFLSILREIKKRYTCHSHLHRHGELLHSHSHSHEGSEHSHSHGNGKEERG